MSGFRSIAAFLRRLRRSTARSTCGSACRRVVLDQLDLALLEVAVELLDVALVDLHLREGGGDFGVGQHPRLPPLGDEEPDLFELLQFGYRHSVPWRQAGPGNPAPGPVKQTTYTVKLHMVKSSMGKPNFR